MLSEVRQKKIMEKLNRPQKDQFWGPKTWGQEESPGPWSPPPGSAPDKSLFLIQDFWTFSVLYFIQNSPKYLMEKKYPKIDHEHPNLYNSKCGADSLRE